jgi:hypothetical protein
MTPQKALQRAIDMFWSRALCRLAVRHMSCVLHVCSTPIWADTEHRTQFGFDTEVSPDHDNCMSPWDVHVETRHCLVVCVTHPGCGSISVISVNGWHELF